MAAPSFVDAGTGATDAGGAWSYTCQAAAAAGRLFIVQVLQDGSTGGAVGSITGTNINAIDGTANTWTAVPGLVATLMYGRDVGSPLAARQQLFLGRATSTSAPTISGGNSTSEDLYIRSYQFTNVSTGSTLADVIENISAGVIDNGAGTSGTIADTGVTTLGPDRLALNFVGLNDDTGGGTLAAFTGQSGGTWAEAVAEYTETTGTDGTLQLQTATISSAGTIDGGTTTNPAAVQAWGVIGLALVGTTLSTPRYPAINHQNPAIV